MEPHGKHPIVNWKREDCRVIGVAEEEIVLVHFMRGVSKASLRAHKEVPPSIPFT